MHSDNLTQLLRHWAYETSSAIQFELFTNGEAILRRNCLDYHILFMDIQLDEINGVETAKQLREKDYSGELVFLTAYAEYVFDGYDVRALNYIMKPISYEKLKTCMGIVMKSLQSEHYILRKRDVYLYGIECFVNEFLADALLLFIGIMTNRLLVTIIWLFFFTAIRTQLGGFHASTHLRCILGSTVIGAICILTYSFFVPYPLWMFLFSILSLVVIIKIAPVVHKNRPISKNRITRVRRRAIAVGCIELVIITGCFSHYAWFSGIVFLALLSATILGLLPVQQSHNQNQNQNGQ